MTLFKDILTSQDLIIELLFITLYPVNLRIIIPKTRCIGFFTTFVLKFEINRTITLRAICSQWK